MTEERYIGEKAHLRQQRYFAAQRRLYFAGWLLLLAALAGSTT